MPNAVKAYIPDSAHILCDEMATKTINATAHETPIRQVVVPDLEPSPVRFAYWTARSLHAELAGLKETVMTGKDELEKIKGKYYPAAVAHEGLPETKGYHQVNRETASLKSITDDEAATLMTAGRWDEVLHVSERAISAAKECRPITLDVGSNEHGWYLYADDWPDALSRVVVVATQTMSISEFLRDLDEAGIACLIP